MEKEKEKKSEPCQRCGGVGYVQVHPLEIPCPVCNKKKVK